MGGGEGEEQSGERAGVVCMCMSEESGGDGREAPRGHHPVRRPDGCGEREHPRPATAVAR